MNCQTLMISLSVLPMSPGRSQTTDGHIATCSQTITVEAGVNHPPERNNAVPMPALSGFSRACLLYLLSLLPRICSLDPDPGQIVSYSVDPGELRPASHSIPARALSVAHHRLPEDDTFTITASDDSYPSCHLERHVHVPCVCQFSRWMEQLALAPEKLSL